MRNKANTRKNDVVVAFEPSRSISVNRDRLDEYFPNKDRQLQEVTAKRFDVLANFGENDDDKIERGVK